MRLSNSINYQEVQPEIGPTTWVLRGAKSGSSDGQIPAKPS